jgi:hypothetical protein
MTAETIAKLLQARRTGTGWQGRCPAHPDRLPSLSIREGEAGRTLVHCHAGCTLPAVLEAAGLRMADLFAGPPPTAEQARQSAQDRARRDAEARNRRAAHGAVCERLRRLEAVCDSLGARFARQPDSGAIAELFHAALDKLRMVEAMELELRS